MTTLARKFLRFVDPEAEAKRMDMRRSMAMIEAHTEDLHRTVITDGDELRRKIAAHFNQQDLDATWPGARQ